MTAIQRRNPGDTRVLPATLHPVLRRVYAARDVGAEQLSLELTHLLPPDGLLGINVAASLLADAIAAGDSIVIAGDYDADGATGTAVGVLGLRALGASAVHYVVPDRFVMGYGLSPALAEQAAATGASVLVTVDNGIASIAGVERARALGLRVIVTDHHLPGEVLPAAHAIVNPNQPGCPFASKALAGVGVMFYLLLALRAELRRRGAFGDDSGPNLASLLDLVAVGTVADLVRLDHNNRILVEQGLRRIRAGRTRPGVLSLLACAGRDPARTSAADIGFGLAPRINAAGRLEDMCCGIECLLTDDLTQARELAMRLDGINRERRSIQDQMQFDAQELAQDNTATGVCLFHPEWHEGVVGLVASKLKESLHRPVIAFAQAHNADELKGSGRSIAGLHLRDVLARIDAERPGLIARFGGHAMAAGLSLRRDQLEVFAEAFDRVCLEQLAPTDLQRVILTDGELADDELNLETALALEDGGPWGQGFAEPLFEGRFDVELARPVGSDAAHIKYRLRSPAGVIDAIDFNGAERMQSRGRVQVVYALAVNRFRGAETVDLRIAELRPG
ncbi:single-stranded-DNA-specific exonuclease RecJ [Sinimarinibacterium sp. CAU 1509]|uniref:single-stranded-DNA-specific exonuclease RecJ n=1 Tax=Sinimarinibacterium sp. CAU 1509 TaxID=2562283 RepID=UPI0010AC03E8|nr:single-stranded-DNA-specific exonuclease RecJ [Sinimarinibacterium sp. CAU 1509]TJY60908.1 single-stranded-DNA-specific exonuclease RecJ [Sinimarinibacterium sp. CAU 1509]